MKEALWIPWVLTAVLTTGAGADPVQNFLRDYRHGFVPYPLPSETSLEEILSVKEKGYTALGLIFTGPYGGGSIDFTRLDEAIEKISADGTRIVLMLAPRFQENEGIYDVLDTGDILPHIHNVNPNYSILDPFDPNQRWKFMDFLSLAAERYGHRPAIIGFVVAWGYQGENGFYNGDFNTRFESLGTVSAGYSPHALREFNLWRRERGTPMLAALPRPSTDTQSLEYIDWMRFRYWFTGEVFQRQMIDTVKAFTERPVGTFGYLPASPENYARAWSYTPNADFLRSAGSTASFDLSRTLLDSGIGWEDAWLHQGKWDFSFPCMKRDQMRQIVRGGTFHGMWCRVYETEPQWEPRIFEEVSDFLIHQRVAEKAISETPTVALFQPTWSTAALNARSPEQPFLPSMESREFIAKMTGLVESFGLPYRPIPEEYLLEPQKLAGFQYILFPLSDRSEHFLGLEASLRLQNDPRVIPLPHRHGALPRSELRNILQSHGISIRLDYEGESILAGMSGNLVYNWSPEPILVQVRSATATLEWTLNAHECRFLHP